jgi:radical SAM superfamily enzyme YgiQ (UPF0313 family)
MRRSYKHSRLNVILIKPSRYDRDGYPITWYRSIIPSNSLAIMYGLARDAARRQILGEEVELAVQTYDETNCRVRPRAIISRIRSSGANGLIGLVGVQTNQFPRAIDLARPFREVGLPVIIGGFHVSGCVAMLPELPQEIQEAQAMGISLFLGEAEEGRFDEVLCDAWQGELKPIYRYLENLPGLSDQPLPYLPASEIRRSNGNSSFDLGRGCPYQCSFCTIINVQGRKSRFRTADDLEQIIRENLAQGVKALMITDDNLARNKNWESFFDRLIRMREQESLAANLTIQVDTLCHKIPNFIEKAATAGVVRVFIGLENINPDNLLAAKKGQNKITEYRRMLQAWRKHGVHTWPGYIVGFPADTKESVLRDVEIIKKELPTDVLEFFVLTPLPGSEDHQKMLQRGEHMDDDLNKYNAHDRVSHHARMSDQEWEAAYDAAWRSYYAFEHIETIARRHAAIEGRDPGRVIHYLTAFKVIYEIEGIHPLEGGILRLKYRCDRRPGLAIEWPGLFHLKLAAESARKACRYLRYVRRAKEIGRKVRADPMRLAYVDTAITPTVDDEIENLMLYTQTAGGEAAVQRKRAEDRLRSIFGSARGPKMV